MSAPAVISLAEKVRRYLTQRNGSALRRQLARHNFADVAEMMESALSPQEAVQCFQYLDVGQAAQVLSSINEDLQGACLSSLPSNLGSRILRMMPTDDAVDILQEMDTDERREILEEMPFDVDTRTLHHLLMEEPDTAAGLMSPDFVNISVEATVGEAMSLIRRAEEKDFIYYCYLVDAEHRLVGVVSLKRLILHDESVPLNRIAEFDVKSIQTTFDQEMAANVFRKYYNLLAMPVVDLDDVLQGVITLDDIVDVIEEESSEDIYRASGINLEDLDEKGLLMGPVMNAFKARIPWLSITLVGQLVGSWIIAHFHNTVSAAVIAVSFMPLLTGLSGNMGTQTDTIAVRGLSQGLINDANILEKYSREIKVALMTGVTFGTVAFVTSYLLYGKPILSMLLAGWIVVSLCVTASLGLLLPYGFKHVFKLDPAGMGGPMITTVSDILTFFLYLSVVTMLLKHMI